MTRGVMAIDPGLAATGIAVYEDRRIRAAYTYTTSGAGYKTEFTAAMRRAEQQADRIEALMLELEPTVIVLELYRDIPGQLRRASNRWTTPLMIGYTLDRIRAHPLVVLQDPERVMTQYRPLVEAWKRKQYGAIAGDALLTNEHTRSAGAHLAAYLDGQRYGGRL